LPTPHQQCSDLPFTDFTASFFAKVVPDEDTQILNYGADNFLGSSKAFASKSPATSLTLSTCTSLSAYGYTNVFELSPLLNVATTKILFEGIKVR
jgi:hypothetical protein